MSHPEVVHRTLPDLGSFPLALVWIEDHPEGPWHSHDYHELVIVLSGAARHHQLTPSGERLATPIAAGDVFVIVPGSAHCYRETQHLELVNAVHRPLEEWMAVEQLEGLLGYHALFALQPRVRADQELKRHFRLAGEELDQARTQLVRLAELLNSREAGHGFEAQITFMQMVLTLSRLYGQQATEQQGNAQGDLVALADLLAYLRHHLAEELTLPVLAQRFGRSPATLLRDFRRATGLPPMQYLAKLRVRAAASLLAESDLTVSDVATRVGLQDSNYFSRIFRRHLGMSPRQWRQQPHGRRMAFPFTPPSSKMKMSQ